MRRSALAQCGDLCSQTSRLFPAFHGYKAFSPVTDRNAGAMTGIGGAKYNLGGQRCYFFFFFFYKRVFGNSAAGNHLTGDFSAVVSFGRGLFWSDCALKST